jgi:cytochrome c oxidase assembly protein subunit 15
MRAAAVGVWLLIVCAFVYVMVLVGGATRLTDSGLSITEWNFVKGVWPPMTDLAWAEEFALYRQTPEYNGQNAGMTLADFQYIYWWEWGHRFLGKVIGVVFAVPFFVFWATGRLYGRFWPVLALFALGGLQGVLGWWMVAGGLDRLDVPSYRLATHLGMAFIILAVGLWLALDALDRRTPKQAKTRAGTTLQGVFTGLLFVQIVAGALVAGIDAGRRYGDWPTIGGEWFPSGYFEHSPWWRNLFESHAAAQFNHRTLGYVLALLGAVLLWRALRHGGLPARWAVATGVMMALQIGLGIVTVMAAAPLGLSLAHQALAAALWVSAVGWMRAVHRMRYSDTAAESLGAEARAQLA